MKGSLKRFILVSIPLIVAIMVGLIFGQEKYVDELQNGSDFSDAARWALIAGLFYGFSGLIIGLVIDIFVWLIGDSNTSKNINL